MRLRLALLLVFCFAVFAAPARADHGATLVNPTLTRYMELAAGYWGGPEPVCTDPDGQVIRPHAVMANSPDPKVAAWAEVGGCRVWLDRDLWRPNPDEQYCNLIAHEWGHLIGREHSGNPRDLMWPNWTNNVVPGCVAFRPAPPVTPARVAAPQKTKLRRASKSKRRRYRRRCAVRRRLHKRSTARRLRNARRHRRCFRRRKPGKRLRVRARSSKHGIEPTSLIDVPSFSAPLAVPLTRS